MDQLQNYIRGALEHSNNQNQNAQKHAQNQLVKLRASDSSAFFLQVAKIASNQHADQLLRYRASIVLFKSAIASESDKSNNVFWNHLSTQNKFAIRQKLLTMLISKSNMIMQAGAIAIAQIASIQLANGQWYDLVDIMAQNTQHQLPNIRMASIRTVGFLCDKLKRRNIQVNSRCCQQLFAGAIIGSRDQNEQIIQISLQALQNSLVFLTPLLAQPKCREAVLKIVSQKILIDKFANSCYQVLFQYIKSCYQYLGQSLNFFVDLTFKHIQARNEQTTMACQFWDSLGTEYLDRCDASRGRVSEQNINNYLGLVAQKMVPEFMKLMLILNKNDIDKQEMRESAAKTISVFCQSCDKKVIDIITNGISYTLQSQNAGERQASVPLFATMCDYNDIDYIQSCLKNGFQKMFSLVSDSQAFVIKSSLLGFTRIFEGYSDLIVKMDCIKNVVNVLFNHIESNPDNEVVKLSLTALVNLTSKLDRHKGNIISSKPEVLLQRVVQFYEKNVLGKELPEDLTEKIVEIIISIIMGSTDNATTIQLIEYMIQKYQTFDNQNQNNNNQKLKMTFTHLISIIHTAVLTLRVSNNAKPLMNKLLDLTQRHKKRCGIDQQVINMISALTLTFGQMFYPKMEESWNIIYNALSCVNQANLFKTTLNTIGDLGRTYDSKFADKGTNVLKILFDIVNKNQIERSQRLSILYCLGDLFLGMKGYACNFVDRAIDICNLCFYAALEMKKQPDQAEYYDELKEAIIDMYACMLFSLNNGQKPSDKLFNNFGQITYFVVQTCNRDANPTVNYLKQCLFLIFDGAQFYWKNVNFRNRIVEIIQHPAVLQLIKILQEVKNRPDLADLIQYIRQRVTRNV